MAAPVRSRSTQPRYAGIPAPRTREPAPRRRPNLRLVDDARLKAAHRRRRARLIVVFAGVMAAGCLFLLAAFNAMLVTGQNRIDHLDKQVAAEQARYSENRLKVAELASPGRIVAEAQQRLGMVPPPNVTYLTPSESMAGEVDHGAGGNAQASDSTGDTGTSWAAVKPYLGGRP